MNDRELLEKAAKAAGIAIVSCTCRNEKWPFKHNESVSGKRGHWNPLVDDGDALRLAAKLRLGLIPLEGGGWDVVKHDEDGNERTLATSANSGLWALRDAIVRAASLSDQEESNAG